MRELIGNLTSPSWWVSVALVAIILDLVAAYLKSWLDAQASRFSSRRKEEFLAKEKARQTLIARLQSDNHEQVMYGLKVLQDYIYCLLLLILSLTFWVLLSPFLTIAEDKSESLPAPAVVIYGTVLMLFVCSMINALLALRYFRDALTSRATLRMARRQSSNKKKPDTETSQAAD